MAPVCADPRQIVISLNPARRQALLRLVDEITSYMISQLETPSEDLGPVETRDKTQNGDGDYHEMPGQGHGQRQAERPQLPERQSSGKLARDAQRVQKAAIKHMSEWKQELMSKLGEIVRVQDDSKIQGERRKRLEEMEKKKIDTPDEGENLITFDDVKVSKSEDVASLQNLYHPIPTRLTTIPSQDRREAVSCILLLLLSTGKYSAYSRTLALYLASALELTQTFVAKEEMEIAKQLMESSAADDKKKEGMSADAEAAKRRQDNQFSRYWKVGLASVAGAAVIGVTGGLAAPLVAGAMGGILGGVGLGGVASFLGIFWMNGALVGALFGAFGAKMTGEMMDKYAKEVEDFKFIPLSEEWGRDYKKEGPKDQEERRLRVTIGINGWLDSEQDITKPWRVMNRETEVFALRYEMKTLLQLGTAMQDMAKSVAWKAFKVEVIKRTVLATLFAALWPISVLSMASNLDNPFSRATNRSRKAGELLADALANRVQGERPVTLVGYSLGAAAIHACLQSLAERRVFGIVDTVVLIGAPAPSESSHWCTLRSVVSGKVFNVYSENDLMLGFVYRMHSLALGVAGLQAIENVEGIENLDLSHMVSGHLRYPSLTGEILKKCGFVGVKAAGEIEKDDLIRMKEEHAEGKLIEFEGEPVDVKPREKRQQQRPGKKKAMGEDLRGLNMSPPALASPGEEQSRPHLPERPKPKAVSETNPPLPQRPSDDAESQRQTIQRKPVNVHSREDPLEPAAEKGVRDAPSKDAAPVHDDQSTTAGSRPLTPESNDNDDGEYRSISMVDNDSEDE